MNSQFSAQITEDQNLAANTQAKIRNNRRVIRRDLTPRVSKTGIHPQNLDAVTGDDDDVEHIITAPALPTVLTSPAAVAATSHGTSALSLSLSPLDLPGQEFRAGLDRRKQNRQLLMCAHFG